MNSVVEVKRVSDRMMSLMLEIEGVMMNVVSVCVCVSNKLNIR